MTKKTRPLIETLENRQLMDGALPVSVDFTPASAAPAGGTVGDVGLVMGARQGGYEYGWNIDSTANAVARTTTYTPYHRHKTFIDMQAGGSRAWEMQLQSGKYKVQVGAGDPESFGGRINITDEGRTVVVGTTTSSKRLLSGTLTLDVTDGKLTIANGADATANDIGYLTIEYVGTASNPAPTPTPTPTPTPIPSPNSGAPTTLGALSWKSAASMPVGKAEAFGGAVGSKLYVFGGYFDSTWKPTDTAHVFDTTKNQWASIARLPVPTAQPATAVDARYIYIAGGYTKVGSNQSFANSKVYRYDTQTNSYQTLPDLPQARGAGGGAIVDGRLYIMGGGDSSRKDRAEVWSLNLNNTAAGWKSHANLPAVRTRFGSVGLDGSVYVVGGQTGNDKAAVYVSSAWRYDPNSDKWTTLASLASARSHNTATTFAHAGRIFTIGGEGVNQAKLKNVNSYDPLTNKWTAHASIPAPRFSGVADVIGGKLYFTSGFNSTFEKTTYVGVFA